MAKNKLARNKSARPEADPPVWQGYYMAMSEGQLREELRCEEERFRERRSFIFLQLALRQSKK